MTTALKSIVDGNINGSTFVSIDTETVPDMYKRNNPHFGRVKKHVTGLNVVIFQNKNSNGYCNMVKRRLEKEGKNPESFKLGERKWGTRLKGTPFVLHNDKLYFEVICLNVGDVYYTLDGVVTPKADIQGLKDNKKKAEQGGLDDKVEIRTFTCSNVKRITIAKQTHELT